VWLLPELTLRALNPQTELDLFRESYGWRPNPKKHLQLNRMSFEEFSADSPNRVVIGLFNGKLCAVYMFIEVRPKVFEAHFSSRKDTPVEQVFAGGKTMLNWFHFQGAIVTAEIVERNRPLRVFVEALGFREADRDAELNLIKYVSRADS
jgi:hypothetical protein